MTVQDVTTPSTFIPYGGPITHSFTGSKPDSPVHPLFPNLFIARGLVCNSRATFKSDIRHDTYSRCFEPLSRPVTGIERLPTRSKLPRIPPYFALDIFVSFNSRVTFRHLARCCRPDSQPCRGPFSQNAHPLFFRQYDGVPEERTLTSS